MAGLSEDVLRKLISPKAKALSSERGDQIVKSKGRSASYAYDPDPSTFDNIDDSIYLAETYDAPASTSPGVVNENEAARLRAMTDYSSNDFNPERLKKSGMLSVIKEEMLNNPIDTSALNTMTINSANGGNISENNARLSKMLAGAKMVEEKLGGKPGRRDTGPAVTGSPGIDYALIKTIVNEALDTRLSEKGAGLKGIVLGKGKIKIIDGNGNIFSAKLEYEGNTKDKK